jgi:hypothetical protein
MTDVGYPAPFGKGLSGRACRLNWVEKLVNQHLILEGQIYTTHPGC